MMLPPTLTSAFSMPYSRRMSAARSSAYPWRSAEIQLHGRVCAGHPIAHHAKIAYARVGADESGDFFGVRQWASRFVSVKAPQSDQLADRGLNRPPDCSARTCEPRISSAISAVVWMFFFAAGDRLVERHQLPGLPRVQLAMHAVEFPENPPDRFVRAHRIAVDNLDLDHGSEHVGTRAVFRRGRSHVR